MREFTYRQVNEDVLRTLALPSWRYLAVLGLLALGVAWGLACWSYQIAVGMGVTGLNSPVGWGVYITNFVFWIGIGHAGTLISAILYLLRVQWRTAIYRAAEMMTVFAVATAGMFPLIHLGRVWVVYWLLPYPNQRHLWPNFQSPLVLDVVAVTTYFTVSVLFLFMGLIPDLAAVRDSSRGWRRFVYAGLSLGWQGENDQWRHYLRAYAALACLATPLVISVHSVVSWDFALGIIPGWHETLFAPYFVVGAIHSGLAMVILLLLPLRRVLGLQRLVRPRHFEEVAKLNIFTGLLMLYWYGTEFFATWYSGDLFARSGLAWKATGGYAGYFWLMLGCNAIAPLAYLWRPVRATSTGLVIVSVLITLGMWLERYVIIVGSLSHDFLPTSWGLYSPSWVEVSVSLGMACFFLLLFLTAVRLVPSVAISELKGTPDLPREERP